MELKRLEIKIESDSVVRSNVYMVYSCICDS